MAELGWVVILGYIGQCQVSWQSQHGDRIEYDVGVRCWVRKGGFQELCFVLLTYLYKYSYYVLHSVGVHKYLPDTPIL